MVDHVIQRAESEWEVRGTNCGSGQVGTVFTALPNVADVMECVDFAEEEGDETEAEYPPGSLDDQERGVRQERRGQSRGRQIGPENQFGVAGHSPLKRGTGMIIGG